MFSDGSSFFILDSVGVSCQDSSSNGASASVPFTSVRSLLPTNYTVEQDVVYAQDTPSIPSRRCYPPSPSESDCSVASPPPPPPADPAANVDVFTSAEEGEIVTSDSDNHSSDSVELVESFMKAIELLSNDTNSNCSELRSSPVVSDEVSTNEGKVSTSISLSVNASNDHTLSGRDTEAFSKEKRLLTATCDETLHAKRSLENCEATLSVEPSPDVVVEVSSPRRTRKRPRPDAESNLSDYKQNKLYHNIEGRLDGVVSSPAPVAPPYVDCGNNKDKLEDGEAMDLSDTEDAHQLATAVTSFLSETVRSLLATVQRLHSEEIERECLWVIWLLQEALGDRFPSTLKRTSMPGLSMRPLRSLRYMTSSNDIAVPVSYWIKAEHPVTAGKGTLRISEKKLEELRAMISHPTSISDDPLPYCRVCGSIQCAQSRYHFCQSIRCGHCYQPGHTVRRCYQSGPEKWLARYFRPLHEDYFTSLGTKMVNTTGLIERPSVLGPRCITCDARGHAVCGRECLSNKAVASFDRFPILSCMQLQEILVGNGSSSIRWDDDAAPFQRYSSASRSRYSISCDYQPTTYVTLPPPPPYNYSVPSSPCRLADDYAERKDRRVQLTSSDYTAYSRSRRSHDQTTKVISTRHSFVEKSVSIFDNYDPASLLRNNVLRW